MGNRTPAARRRPDVLSSPFQPQPITILRFQPKDELFLKMPTVFHLFQSDNMSLLWFDICLDILLLKWWVILIFCLVIHFCVMQHQQQDHPPSGTEINAAPASDKWRTGSETESHRQRKTFVCACSMISPLSYFTNPLWDIWRDPLFRMELGDTTDVSSISTRSTF